jgi:hypothetical protein
MSSSKTRGGFPVDWKRIKAEYIAGGTSYRKLAEKYGVPRSNLERVAKREGWTALRRQTEDKAEAEIIDAISKKSANIDTKYFDLVDKLLDKASEVIELMPEWSIVSLKDMATTMKYLKECKGVKSDADMREQEARIRNLERQAEADNESKDIKVTIEGDLNEYSN